PYTPLIPNHRVRFGFSLGGPVTPWKILGGKTYFFVNYEGFRYPNATTFERNYPTAAFRAGVIQVPFTDGGTTYQVAYNLNPTPVTVQIGNPTSSTSPSQTCTIPGYGSVYGAGCGHSTGGVAVDPRGLGMSPTISSLWSKFLPIPNDALSGDQFNTQGFLSTI